MRTRTGPLTRSASAASIMLAVAPTIGAAAEHLPPGASSCAGCHAARQEKPDAPPSLAGLPAKEIASALAGYRDGTRAGTIMPRIAAGFSDAEARAIADALGRPDRIAP